jgi:hypothetical protein
MEQNKYLLEVEGSMYEANYLEITDRQYKDLRAKGERSKTWKKIEDRLLDDSLINGFTFSHDYPHFDMNIGVEGLKRKVDEWFGELMNSEIDPDALRTIQPNKKWLVFEKWCDGGYLTMTLNDEFDPAKLEIGHEIIEMPNGRFRWVAEIAYGGECLSFQSSMTRCEETYVYSLEDGKTAL